MKSIFLIIFISLGICQDIPCADEPSEMVPEQFSLYPPYPNPFNPTTTIRFNIGVGDALLRHPTLTIFNITGRIVDVLVNEKLHPGQHEIQWNAWNQPSGIYFVELTIGEVRQVQKMVLMK